MMATEEQPVPRGDEAEARWRRLSWRRRMAMTLGGESPRDRAEALTALGYGGVMRERSRLWAIIGAIGSLVAVLALDLIITGGLSTGSFGLAGIIGFGVALALETGGQAQGHELQRRARRSLGEETDG